MTISYQEAIAAVTAPGQRFETDDAEIDGRSTTSSATHRAPCATLFAGARDRGDRDFLVYEDEHWSFAEVMRHVDALGRLLVHEYGVRRRRPGRDRHAQLPRVDHELRGDDVGRAASPSPSTHGGRPTSSTTPSTTPPRRSSSPTASGSSGAYDGASAGASAFSASGWATAALPDGVERWEDVLPLGGPDARPGPRPRRRRHDPVHVGHHRAPKGAVSTHRAVIQSLMGFGCRTAIERARQAPVGRRRRADGTGDASAAATPSLILVVPLFHVTGLIPVMLGCFSSGVKLVIMYRWDAGAGAGDDRARAGDLVRRRPHAELGHARVAPLRRVRHVQPGRPWAAAGRPMPPADGRPGREELRRGPAVDRLRHDRDQRLRAGPLRRRLRPPPDLHRPGHADHAGRGARRGRQRAADRRGGRDLVRRPAPDPRLLEQARGHRRDDRRRLAAHRRPGAASTTRASSTSRTG